jgi:hypothetical protein
MLSTKDCLLKSSSEVFSKIFAGAWERFCLFGQPKQDRSRRTGPTTLTYSSITHNLHCYVVIDLKVREFEPEYAGKMNFYLSAIDELLRRQGDGPSIGLILCKGKGKTTVEYALRDTNKPIGVSSYQHALELPHPLQGENAVDRGFG